MVEREILIEKEEMMNIITDIVKEINIEDQDPVQDQKRNPTHREKNANIIETILLRIDQTIQINQTETKLSTRQ